jgi:hypothetical protein
MPILKLSQKPVTLNTTPPNSPPRFEFPRMYSRTRGTTERCLYFRTQAGGQSLGTRAGGERAHRDRTTKARAKSTQ